MTHSLFLRKMPDGTRWRTYFCLPILDSVAGVVAAGVADDDVRPFGEHVNDFAFAFIAPLGADENCICHNFVKSLIR